MDAISSKAMFDASIKKAIDQIIKNNSVRVFEKACNCIKDKHNKTKIDYGFAFKKYMNRAYEKYSKIKTLLYKDEPKDLYSFYEDCYLKTDSKKILCDDVNKLLDISHYCIIQGLGGMGKSTVLKHLFLNELLKEDLIPIFIELKSYNSKEMDLLKCMYTSINNLGFSLPIEYFIYALQQGHFLILLDGYDEMRSDIVPKFNNEFHDFCDKYDTNYYILTSRPQEETFISWNRFSVFQTVPFTKSQAINLIDKIEYDNDTKSKFIKALDIFLYDTHKSFASNPLLLNIMLLTFNEYAYIPSKLHIFYDNAFETLYNKHDATKGCYQREMKSDLTYDVFKKVFSTFCFRTYYINEYEFSLATIKAHLSAINDKLPKDERFDVDNYIYDLEYSLCLIYKDGREYKFTHRSFQEYFVAVYISTQTDEKAKLCSTKLIENDLARITRDMTFSMLFDMNSKKFEKCIELHQYV